MWDAHPNVDGSWHAGSGAVFDLRSHQLRPAGWTSADAAGLPVAPGLVRYDEVAAGRIDHAVRVTVPHSQNSYVWPARHAASSNSDPALPPMGVRLRLKAGTNVSALPPQARVIAEAMKTYGVIVADNGSPWYLSGAPDSRWSAARAGGDPASARAAAADDGAALRGCPTPPHAASEIAAAQAGRRTKTRCMRQAWHSAERRIAPLSRRVCCRLFGQPASRNGVGCRRRGGDPRRRYGGRLAVTACGPLAPADAARSRTSPSHREASSWLIPIQ